MTPPARPLDVVLESVALLWPGSQARVVARGTTLPDSPAPDRRFLLVPNARSPRLLTPESPAASAAAMRRFSQALTVRERITRSSMGWVLATGLGHRTTEALEVLPSTSSEESITDHLREVLGQPVVVALSVGKARANQKPILQVFTADGAPLAFAKVGTNTFTSGLVRHEAAALRTLREHTWQHLVVPELIHQAPWRGHEVLVMTPLATPGVRGWNRRDEVPDAAMAELSEAFLEPPTTLAGSEFWTTLVADAEQRRVRTSGARFADALHTLTASIGATALPLGAWHGDWSPWNMAWIGDRVALWDWERFGRGVPQGFDHLHYAVSDLIRSGGLTSATVLEAIGGDRSIASSDGSVRTAVASSYVAALTHRYLDALDQPGGDVMQRPADVVLDVLESLAHDAEEQVR